MALKSLNHLDPDAPNWGGVIAVVLICLALIVYVCLTGGPQ